MVVILRHSDILAVWEDFMADAGHGLMIKYGLRNAPPPDLIQRWANLANQYINGGMNREAAGHAAAKVVFLDYRKHVYASEADTIEMLLQQVGNK